MKYMAKLELAMSSDEMCRCTDKTPQDPKMMLFFSVVSVKISGAQRRLGFLTGNERA